MTNHVQKNEEDKAKRIIFGDKLMALKVQRARSSRSLWHIVYNWGLPIQDLMHSNSIMKNKFSKNIK